MQVREPRMAENRASAVIDSSEKFLWLRGQGEIFLHWCLVRKIEFSPLSLCSAIENYYNSKSMNDWMNYAHLMVSSQEQDSTNVSFGDSTS